MWIYNIDIGYAQNARNEPHILELLKKIRNLVDVSQLVRVLWFLVTIMTVMHVFSSLMSRHTETEKVLEPGNISLPNFFRRCFFRKVLKIHAVQYIWIST